MTAAEPWERPCTTCDGSGRVISQAWLAWHAEYGRLERLTDMTSRLTALADHVRRTPQEPEEATCPECGGDGVVVTELGLVLLDFLDRRFGVRPRTPKAGSRSLPPPPPIEPPGADPYGRSGIAWAGPPDQSPLFAQAIAGGPMRAITSGVPYTSHPDAASAFGGQADEADPLGETSHNRLPAVATLAASTPADLVFDGADSAGDGLPPPPPDLAGLPSVPPIPPDGNQPPGIPPIRGVHGRPRALPPAPPDPGPPLGARPQWQSDDTDH
jgi:hypothetical protein